MPWCEKDSALALVAFLNAGDPMGVGISGVKTRDTIEFVTATGIASFSEDTENAGGGAFISVVAAGAKATATAFGNPELVPSATGAGGEKEKTEIAEG